MRTGTRRGFLRTGTIAAIAGSRLAKARGTAEDVHVAVHPFPAGTVRLLDPLRARQELNRAYLLSLDPDRLLHNFRVNAGWPSTAEPLGGWEAPASGLRGHFTGHYLAACALASRTSPDRQLAARADYVVGELARCQKALGGAYLAAFPATVFDTLETRYGGVRAPYYTIHKVMAGLLAVHTHTGNGQALEMCGRMATYFGRRLSRLAPDALEKMLYTAGPNPSNEFGGMGEALHDLYAITGERAHLRTAHVFDREWLLGPLARGEDILSGLHANTHIPVVLGAARHYEITGHQPYREAALFFWDRVVAARSYVTGGSSGPRPAGGGGSPGGEHWGEPYRLAGTLTPRICESCVTHNMLRLTDRLFRWTADPRYADYAERALFNSVLPMMHPRRRGAYVYEQALGSGSRKFYGGAEDTFRCCYGTSVEAFAGLAAGAYYHSGEALWVNQFVASTVDWREKGIRVEQDTAFPDPPDSRLTIHTATPQKFTLYLRIPEWTSPATPILLNGVRVAASLTPGSFLPIERTWKEGDTVRFEFPVALRARPMPDDPRMVALEYGPLVLAAQTHEELVFAGRPQRLLASARRESIAGPRFSIPIQEDKEVTLVPLNQIVDEPYGVYLTCLPENTAELAGEMTRLHSTVDRVAIYDARSETEHELGGDKTAGEMVRFLGAIRRAGAGGWFAYRLRVLAEEPTILRTAYAPETGGAVTFDILVDGTKIAEQSLGPVTATRAVTIDRAIPPELTRGKSAVRVTFRARADSPTGRVCDLRMVRTGIAMGGVRSRRWTTGESESA
jgi:uncharacterized protein